MLKYFYSFILLFLITNSFANNKENITNNLKNTNSINFNFEQNINQKIEKGNCTVQYPKKIFCKYESSNDKILVSNGKSLVIKTRVSYYRYPLEKTPLNLILDKNFLINKIYNQKERVVDDQLVNFIINENDNKISIFFDKETYDLIGWQNTDIYQNFNIIFISSIRKNRVLKKDLFKLPNRD